ncbi:hypothetical protein B0H19DRAFT_1065295 [Mycena capillaripes]|nr:hypothetical protein B0H19DRAFT_1065295 [Mycena capillaripes]
MSLNTQPTSNPVEDHPESKRDFGMRLLKTLIQESGSAGKQLAEMYIKELNQELQHLNMEYVTYVHNPNTGFKVDHFDILDKRHNILVNLLKEDVEAITTPQIDVPLMSPVSAAVVLAAERINAAYLEATQQAVAWSMKKVTSKISKHVNIN